MTLSTHRNRSQRAQINSENRDNELRARWNIAQSVARLNTALAQLALALDARKAGDDSALVGIIAAEGLTTVAMDMAALAAGAGRDVHWGACYDWLLANGYTEV